MTITIDVEVPGELKHLHLPKGVAARLQTLLDRQSLGQTLTTAEREEAKELVDLADFFTLLQMRAAQQAP
ncbi:hypothetical protein [Aeoliella mucimassa]|uniref:Uncharacterized protein n=1 Tax=Aeoliella mucimassa TaxID=2527972 RepID=A0A518ALF4_9BACT|nr:hypothetical protein [Aeoliella mucimassa]QDU55541.1 hypothetical protein Pan181_17330 [Aeoliella mucimassa]